jgi:hypothetical protein
LLEAENLDFDLIRPLIAETADKVQLYDPETVQTGPALREDTEIINSHLEMLQNKPELEELYKKLSQSIVNLSKQPRG